ncbi:carboxylesterase family protein [Streptomyces anulatus]
MRQEWSPEELLANWTLVDGDWDLVANKSGATRLGFSLLLKFFELEGRFPDVSEEVPPTAVEYVADLVKVPATDFAKYTLSGRTAEYHRKQIREALGFRPSTVADEKALAEWLAVEVCPVELVEDRQREALLVECRARKIEPPGRTRVEKVLVAARGKWEKAFCARTIGRLGEACPARLLSLVAEDNEAGTALLAALKRDPGAVGLDSLLTEITKLNDVRKLGLPDGLFADRSEKLVAAWRARAIKMYPSDFRDTSEDVRITLLAALCSSRQAEITDALVDLLVALVHKINARAERRVEKQLTAELKKVRGKEGILFKLATAAVDKPDEVVRRALFPVVGEKTLRELVAEAKANEKVFKAKVRTTLRLRSPAPAAPWDGVRDCVGFGAAPPQLAPAPTAPPAWRPGAGLDCLTLNVWSPDIGAAGLPVMVWIYGGLWKHGSSNMPQYDASTLAGSGTVVVTFNYRVGFEGFGHLPGVADNRGLRDQIAALEWVRDNITAFGGDPANVTVFGQSAGAASTALLMAAPAARGLFRRAITQSIPSGIRTGAEAESVTATIAAALGVAPIWDAFAALPPETILAVQDAPLRDRVPSALGRDDFTLERRHWYGKSPPRPPPVGPRCQRLRDGAVDRSEPDQSRKCEASLRRRSTSTEKTSGRL